MGRVLGILIVALIFFCGSPAYAVYFVDTGFPPNPSSPWGIVLSRSVSAAGAESFQWLAGQFTLSEAHTARTLETIFSYVENSANITIALYPDLNSYPDTSNELFHNSFTIGTSDTQKWEGLLNENINLSAGTYWFAVEVRSPDVFYGALTVESLGASWPNKLATYHFANEYYPDYYGSGGANPFSVRIGDVAQGGGSVIPEPASLSLLGLGLSGLLFRRKRIV